MTDVELDARVTALEESGGGENGNGQNGKLILEFSHNYTKLAMLSFLFWSVVKGKLLWAKGLLPPVGIEPATPTP